MVDVDRIKAAWTRTLGPDLDGPTNVTLRPDPTLSGVDTLDPGGTLSGASTVGPDGAAGTLSGGSTVAGASPDDPTPSPLRRPLGSLDLARDFDLIEQIGSGGMGVVFRARQRSLDREIAIKRIGGEGGGAAAKAKFVSEALVTGSLDHPNIVPVHGLHQDSAGELLLAMKLVGGVPWSALLHPRNDEERARAADTDLLGHLAILDAVCNAVAFAHSKGIIHRDLKPDNVMVGTFGEVLLMDWGIAVDIDDGRDGRAPHRSSIRAPAGTPCYLAPEMAEGLGTLLGPWTDVYLLGSVLHEILTGRPPHAGGDLMAVLLAASRSERPRFDRDVPPGLAEVCRRAMARQPQDRYQTAGELQSAIADWRGHHESERIAADAEVCLARARDADAAGADETSRNRIYGDYAEAVAGYRQALTLWPDNPAARRGGEEARLAYADAAIAGGDLGLAGAQAEALPTDHVRRSELQQRIGEERRRRDRTARAAKRLRTTVLGAASVIVIGLSIGVLLVNQQRRRAEQAQLAEADQRQAAEVARDQAEDARQQAVRARDQAEVARAAEAEQREAAEAAREAETEQREAAELARDQEAAARKQAITEAWLARLNQAEARYEQALALSSEGRPAAAAAYLLRAVEIAPPDSIPEGVTDEAKRWADFAWRAVNSTAIGFDGDAVIDEHGWYRQAAWGPDGSLVLLAPNSLERYPDPRAGSPDIVQKGSLAAIALPPEGKLALISDFDGVFGFIDYHREPSSLTLIKRDAQARWELLRFSADGRYAGAWDPVSQHMQCIKVSDMTRVLDVHITDLSTLSALAFGAKRAVMVLPERLVGIRYSDADVDFQRDVPEHAAAALSSDARWASAIVDEGAAGVAHLWRIDANEVVAFEPTLLPAGAVPASELCALDRSGRLVAMIDDHLIQIDLRTGRLLDRRPIPDGRTVRSIQLDHEGQQVALTYNLRGGVPKVVVTHVGPAPAQQRLLVDVDDRGRPTMHPYDEWTRNERVVGIAPAEHGHWVAAVLRRQATAEEGAAFNIAFRRDTDEADVDPIGIDLLPGVRPLPWFAVSEGTGKAVMEIHTQSEVDPLTLIDIHRDLGVRTSFADERDTRGSDEHGSISRSASDSYIRTAREFLVYDERAGGIYGLSIPHMPQLAADIESFGSNSVGLDIQRGRLLVYHHGIVVLLPLERGAAPLQLVPDIQPIMPSVGAVDPSGRVAAAWDGYDLHLIGAPDRLVASNIPDPMAPGLPAGLNPGLPQLPGIPRPGHPHIPQPGLPHIPGMPQPGLPHIPGFPQPGQPPGIPHIPGSGPTSLQRIQAPGRSFPLGVSQLTRLVLSPGARYALAATGERGRVTELIDLRSGAHLWADPDLRWSDAAFDWGNRAIALWDWRLPGLRVLDVERGRVIGSFPAPDLATERHRPVICWEPDGHHVTVSVGPTALRMRVFLPGIDEGPSDPSDQPEGAQGKAVDTIDAALAPLYQRIGLRVGRDGPQADRLVPIRR